MSGSYEVIIEGAVPIKTWTRGVLFEDAARQQLLNVSRLPCVFHHVAAMPDVHWGFGATVGSVIPTKGAIIPAAVGVDIGCGMIAQRTSLTSYDLGDDAKEIFDRLGCNIPVGGPGEVGSWPEAPFEVLTAWKHLVREYDALCERWPGTAHKMPERQLGTLGTGNHFVEVCIDEADAVWLMLHSGSRGAGHRIGVTFIELAKRDMEQWMIHLPDADLAYLPEGTGHFEGYIAAVGWAQGYARINRQLMMGRALFSLRQAVGHPFDLREEAVNCHHNYVERENHYGQNVWVTRKGAVRARVGDLGIIPGSMGARSFIVRGKGNPESFNSCSHGAGRAKSRAEGKRTITLAEHIEATKGVVCRKDAGVLDESPPNYKDIDAVMAAQSDLVEIVHTLKQCVCLKG